MGRKLQVSNMISIMEITNYHFGVKLLDQYLMEICTSLFPLGMSSFLKQFSVFEKFGGNVQKVFF